MSASEQRRVAKAFGIVLRAVHSHDGGATPRERIVDTRRSIVSLIVRAHTGSYTFDAPVSHTRASFRAIQHYRTDLTFT
jgi:hypothetical protein